MARVLLHTLVFSPDGVSTAYLMTDLARQLCMLGHKVTVLTTTPHYNLVESSIGKQRLEPRWGGILHFSDCDGIPVWHVSMALKTEKTSRRLVDFIRFHLLSLLVSLRLVGKFDIVLAPSPPLTMGIMSWLLGKYRGVPSIYNIQEIYPDFAINQGILRNRRMIALMRWVERFVYSRNHVIVPISDWFRRILKDRGVSDDKLVVIPNFVDTELYRPFPRNNQFAEQNGLLNDFVVGYAGNIGLSQDWESLLFAAETVRQLPIRFVIVGDGVTRKWLEAEVRERGLINVRLLGYQPRELMPLINASCDIATIPMRAKSTVDTFPSKIYTILACGRSCVVSADEDSELAWVIRQSGCGRWVPPENPQAYTNAICQAFTSRGSLAAEGAKGREFVEKDYSKEVVALQYDRLIRRLTDA
jgi:colanic acid biosynthesis glycosyl transferase WcaI